jgi:hypothetical protein
MAQAPTIPVRVRKDHDEEGKLYQLSYDTRVLLPKGFPAIDRIDILPYTNNYRRVFVRQGELSKHYEIRWAKDLMSRWSNNLDPNRGKVITRVSPVKLLGFPAGTHILFRLDGAWELGEIQDHVNQVQAKKAVEKVKKKAKEKIRKYLRLPTIWDRLSRDD